jgi:hypothetical protein
MTNKYNFKINAVRYFGEPKIKKPKYINNKTLIGSVRMFGIGGEPKCKVYLYENRIYVHIRDHFSVMISRDKALELGYVDKLVTPRFAYRDDTSVVGLRNEALISYDMQEIDLSHGNPSYVIHETYKGVSKAYHEASNMEQECVNYLRYEDFFYEIGKLVHLQKI